MIETQKRTVILRIIDKLNRLTSQSPSISGEPSKNKELLKPNQALEQFIPINQTYSEPTTFTGEQAIAFLELTSVCAKRIFEAKSKPRNEKNTPLVTKDLVTTIFLKVGSTDNEEPLLIALGFEGFLVPNMWRFEDPRLQNKAIRILAIQKSEQRRVIAPKLSEGNIENSAIRGAPDFFPNLAPITIHNMARIINRAEIITRWEFYNLHTHNQTSAPNHLVFNALKGDIKTVVEALTNIPNQPRKLVKGRF